METSCGIIILNEFNEILLCHVTGQPQYDIPKGLLDDGEHPIECAIRETLEETGLHIPHHILHDLGEHDYIPHAKRLHAFTCTVLKEHIELDKLECTSYFKDYYTHEDRPEVDDYEWFNIDNLSPFVTKNMYNTLSKLLITVSQYESN